MISSNSQNRIARVVAVHRSHWLVQDESGTLHKATARYKAGSPVVGDRVTISDAGGDNVHIDRIEPRSSSLQRISRLGIPKPLAANHTKLVIVCAPAPGIDRLLIDQYIIAALYSGVSPLLVINKSDLIEDQSTLEPLRDCYRLANCESVVTCATEALGLQQLSQQLEGEVAIFVGPSGVGKSSIIQHFVPDRDIRVGALSAAGMGSHTTTASVWYDMPTGGAVIDSPGVREFRLDHIPVETVHTGFEEINKLAQQCKFANCSHRHEPQCAVQTALGEDSLDRERYGNYLQLLKEAEEASKTRLH